MEVYLNEERCIEACEDFSPYTAVGSDYIAPRTLVSLDIF